MIHNTNNQQVRETCRACHNICYVSADADGVAPPVAAEGYRCEGCEAANYERYDFDKSLPNPKDEYSTESTNPLEPPPPIDPNTPTDIPEPPNAPDPTEPTEVEQPAEEPKSGNVVEVS